MIAQFGDIFGSDPDFAGGTGAGGDVDRALGRVTYDESALQFALSECAQELERVTGERDRARDVAVALEQENAEWRALCLDVIEEIGLSNTISAATYHRINALLVLTDPQLIVEAGTP